MRIIKIDDLGMKGQCFLAYDIDEVQEIYPYPELVEEREYWGDSLFIFDEGVDALPMLVPKSLYRIIA